jgi:hypothetical protein
VDGHGAVRVVKAHQEKETSKHHEPRKRVVFKELLDFTFSKFPVTESLIGHSASDADQALGKSQSKKLHRRNLVKS